MQKKYITTILALSVLLMGFSTFAQIRNTDIVLVINPEFPSPNQDTKATISSHSLNLDKANISWSLNGEELARGIGKKSFSFKVGAAGVSSTVSISIDTVDGQSISKSLTITPANVDMLWEAPDAYAPAFYRGKTLVPSQGTFKVVAMPNLINQDGKVNMNNLSYTWKKDGKIQSASSGWGKTYFIFQHSYLDKENTAEVKISDITSGTNASGKITLKPSTPKILFYENDPSLGVRWEKSLASGFKIGANGKTLVVEPYFFSPKDINKEDLSFDWYLNGTKIETPIPKNSISIKPNEGQSGSALIKVDINNIGTLFQSLTKQIQVSF